MIGNLLDLARRGNDTVQIGAFHMLNWNRRNARARVCSLSFFLRNWSKTLRRAMMTLGTEEMTVFS
jgi:hypothetical protein